MRTISLGIVLIAAAAGLGACDKKDDEQARKKTAHGDAALAYAIHTDTAPLAAKLRFPSPPAEVRWVEMARSASRAPGPTDTRLWVLAKPAAGDRAAWEKALGASVGRSDFHLQEALADSLLGAAAASLALDSLGRNVPGPYFSPDSLTTSWYEMVAAAWIGESVLLESASH
jgi:hypothetical protein